MERKIKRGSDGSERILKRIKVQGYSAQGGKVGRRKVIAREPWRRRRRPPKNVGKENREHGRVPPISLFFFLFLTVLFPVEHS